MSKDKNTEKPIQQIINPLLERVRIPGETHRIPSRGIFYSDGELDSSVKDGEVHVYPMTTIDEIILKSPDKLFSGQSVVEVFKRCVPEVRDPLMLFAKDVDFLLVALRKVSYGNETEIKFTHTCKNAKEHSYVVSLSAFLKKTRYLDPLTIQEEYKITLDNGQIVEIHPIKFQNVLELIQIMVTGADESEEDEIVVEEKAEDEDVLLELDAEQTVGSAPEKAKKDKKDPLDRERKTAERFIDTTSSIIKRVDEVEDKEFIKQWLQTIPLQWSKQISSVIEKTGGFGPDLSGNFKCKDCKGTMLVSPIFNPLIFFSA